MLGGPATASITNTHQALVDMTAIYLHVYVLCT